MSRIPAFIAHRRLWLLPLLAWAAVVFSSLQNQRIEIKQQSEAVAAEGARNMFRMVVMTRAWNARHGGVYVPVDEKTQPNPYLDHPRRDLTTTDGQQLTMVNPAFMTRLIAELAQQQSGAIFHITSLKPYRPGNEPDEWERAALESFEVGKKEALDVVGPPQAQQMRYMAPLPVAKPCLVCHEKQGYKEGDIRGGISVSVPYAPIAASIFPAQRQSLLTHLAVFLLVALLGGVALEMLRRRWRMLDETIADLDAAQRNLFASNEKLHGVTDELRRSHDELEMRVRERTADLEQKNIELAENEEKLRLAASVFSNSYDGVLITDAHNMVVDVNPAFTRITGYERDEIIGRSPGMLSSQRQPPEFYREMWHSLQTRDFWQGEIWNRRKDGEVYAERLSISVVRDKQQSIRHYIAVFTDISQIKAHEAELNQIAHYDPLTGIPNRRLLADRLNQGILHARRIGNSLAVCYLDLDGFKPINDQHGHAVGDLFLIEMANRLKQELRGEDTLARLGGDEFVIILTNVTDSKEIHVVLDRVLSAVNAVAHIEGLTISTTASIGVTLFPDDNADPDTLLRHADQAMYLAKDAGKNRYQIFDPEHDRQMQTHRSELQRLRTALEQNEFVMFYQPKVDLISGEVVGAEALIRWQHPERGLVPPGAFLPHIEGSDLEFPLGEWVVDQVMQQIQQWNAAGIRLTVSANISADHLLQPTFVERLQQTLARYPEVAPASLELEILETVALADMEQAINVLTECRRLGIRLALDDFGTGYSSLAYFRSLPVDILKVDQSFVRHMLEDPDDLGLVESVVRLARAFNRHVIAEGVETLEHGALLLQLGCPLAQGYGVAKPMPAERIPSWIDAWRQQQVWLGIDRRTSNAAQMALQVAALSVRNWAQQIEAYIRHPEGDPPCALDSTRSRFGRWYRGSGAARYNELTEFCVIEPLHETMHVIATGLVALARDGQGEIACEALPGLHATRDQLLEQIEALQRQVANQNQLA